MSRGLARFASAMPAPLRSRLAPALLGLGLLAPVLAPAHAAEIPGEYFFNVDPGVGAATPLTLPLDDPAAPLDPAVPLSASGSLALSIPLASDEPATAPSLLGLRFRDSDGAWGPTQLHRLHVLPGAGDATLSLAWGSADPVTATPAADGTLTITRPASAPGDADHLTLRAGPATSPGPASSHRVHPFGGSAPTRLHFALDQSPDSAASTAYVELSEAHRLAPTLASLPLPAPTPGYHPLHLQLHDAAGARTTTVRPLHLIPKVTPSLALAWGSGDPVELPLAAEHTLTVTRPDSAPGDADRLVIRTRVGASFDGPAFAFRVQPLGGALPARLYYALDRSPDPASSPFLELSETQRLAASELTLDPGPAAPGFHTLHLQLHDSRGTRTEQIRPLHVTPSGVHTLAGLAYTFQPVGDGAPSVIELAPLRVTAELQDVLLLPPPDLPPGAYALVVQLADFSGELGPATPGGLFVGGAYDRWATAALEGRPADETGPLADPDNDQIVNLLEYAFGHDPLQRNASASHSIRAESTPSAAPFFVVEYRQREGGVGQPGVDYTAGGLRYAVEASSDLQTWIPFSEVPGIGHHGSSRTNSDGTETVLLEIFYGDALDSAQRLFLRLKVSAVP